MIEIWKPIKNYEGCYEISNFGRVKSLSRQVKGGRITEELILKPIKNTHGYLQVDLCLSGKMKHHKIHRKEVITMPDKKLTDSEIVKALECCARPLPHCYCGECPAGANGGCAIKTEDIINLINRLEKKFKFAENINHLQMEEVQNLKEKNNVLAYELENSLQDAENKQAEIERLKDKYTECSKRNCDLMGALMSYKAEAYKECIEKAKEELYEWVGADNCVTYPRIKRVLDNLLKEMVGEDK